MECAIPTLSVSFDLLARHIFTLNKKPIIGVSFVYRSVILALAGTTFIFFVKNIPFAAITTGGQ